MQWQTICEVIKVKCAVITYKIVFYFNCIVAKVAYFVYFRGYSRTDETNDRGTNDQGTKEYATFRYDTVEVPRENANQ